MSKTCEACLWISSDEAEVCERCGEPFDRFQRQEINTGAIGSVITTVIGLGALAILGIVGYQQLSGRVPNLQVNLSVEATNFYHWLLGPNEVLKPFVILALALPAVVMVVLWVMARFR